MTSAARGQSARARARRLLAAAAPPRRWASTRRPRRFTNRPPHYTATYYGQIGAGAARPGRSRPARPADFTAQERSMLSNLEIVRAVSNSLRARRTRHARVDLCRARRKRHRRRRPGGAGRTGRQARRRPRHAAARQGRATAAACRSTITPTRPSACRDYTPIAPPVEAGGDLFDRAPGKPLQSEDRLDRQRHGPDAGDAGRGAGDTAKKFKVDLQPRPPAQRSRLQHADGRGRTVRCCCQRLQRLLYHDLRRLQCRPRPRAAVDRRLRRSARPQSRSGRLGRAHPDRRDAQLRAADHGEPAGLPRALRRQQQAGDRSRPQARRDTN